MSPLSKAQYWGTVSLHDLVIDLCQSLEQRLTEQNIHTEIDISTDHQVVADRELLRRAVRNLILTSIDAMPQGGTLTVTSAVGPCAVELEIADTGPGLSESELRCVFDHAAVMERGGTGWGLAVVDRIAQLHGGNITVANCPDGGVAFTLRMPLTAALEAAA